MSLIEWKESFSVGNAEIDRQHRKLIAILNRAHDTMMTGKYEDLSTLGTEAVRELIAYGKEHFAFEEAYMRQIGFPEAQKHKKYHDRFMEEIDNIVLEIHREEHVLNSEILKMMENWLKHHILIEDQKYNLSNT